MMRACGLPGSWISTYLITNSRMRTPALFPSRRAIFLNLSQTASKSSDAWKEWAGATLTHPLPSNRSDLIDQVDMILYMPEGPTHNIKESSSPDLLYQGVHELPGVLEVQGHEVDEPLLVRFSVPLPVEFLLRLINSLDLVNDEAK